MRDRGAYNRGAKNARLWLRGRAGQIALGSQVNGKGAYARELSARNSPGRVPFVGEGRKRRYPPEAVAAFQALRVEASLRHGRPRLDGLPVRRRVNA